jgi:hypothetical protein
MNYILIFFNDKSYHNKSYDNFYLCLNKMNDQI